MRLDNRVAVVTGAGSGIGRAIARGLARAGATVAAVDRDDDAMADTVAAIGAKATPFHVDLSDAQAIRRLPDAVSAEHGLPDVIVNAAGFDRVEPFLANDEQLWESLVAVNFLGPVRLTHAFLRRSSRAGVTSRSSTSLVTRAGSAASERRSTQAPRAA